MTLWPKRSKKISPGCIVATPMRGVAAKAGRQISASSRKTTAWMRRSACRARGSGVTQHPDVEGVHAARVGAGDPEHEASQREFLAGFGQVADRGRDQAADGVVFVVIEI